MSRLQTAFVLGFHGCEREIGEKALSGEIPLLHSKGHIDWLGAGTYFWESDEQRAWEWANEKAARGDYKDPFVIGAAIDMGNCLDLLMRENLDLVREAYQSFADITTTAGLLMPTNAKAPKDPSPDLVWRKLDCAVMNHLHKMIEQQDEAQPYDTVRALFGEGEQLYEGSGFRAKTHCQIAVRNPDCIKGIFRVKSTNPSANTAGG